MRFKDRMEALVESEDKIFSYVLFLVRWKERVVGR